MLRSGRCEGRASTASHAPLRNGVRRGDVFNREAALAYRLGNPPFEEQLHRLVRARKVASRRRGREEGR